MAELIFRQRSVHAWEPAAYTTNEIATVIPVGVGDVVGGAFMRITEAFNGSTGDPTIGVGDSGARARFMTTANCGAPTVGLKGGVTLASMPGYLYTAADTVDINFVEDTSADTTSGVLDLWIYVAQAYPH